MQKIQAQQIKEAAKSIQEYGYAVIKGFLNQEKCQAAIQEIDRLVDSFEPTPETMTVFGSTNNNSKHRSNQYFLDSADKVSFFFEPKALEDGKLIVPKAQAINKIGHALHQHNKIFEDITYTPGVWQLCQQLGIKDPLVMQSMAILKPPKIGNRVRVHQDLTFLYTQPQTLMGFWVPLQNATVENGCLWGIPGSHKMPLYHRSRVINGEPIDEYPHEIDYKDEDFVPIEMEAGSIAVFTGRFLHKSHNNTSDRSRYAYSWHLIDSNSKWSPDNWLQRPSFPKFIRRE